MSIKEKLIITFIVIAAIPMFLISVLSFFNAKDSLRQATLSGLNVVAEFKEGEVLLYLEKLKTRNSDFASDGFIRNRLENIDNEGAMEMLNTHLLVNKKSLDNDLILIDVLDLNGKVRASTEPIRVGSDKSEQQYFKRGERETYIEDIHREEDGTLSLEVYTPLKTREDPFKIIGVLVNHYKVEIINTIMTGEMVLGLGAKTQLRGIGKTGETYLVNQDRIMLSDSLVIEDAAFRQRVDTYPVKKCLEENEEVNGIWYGYLGVSVVGASMCLTIGDFTWVLISEQNEAEAFGQVNSLRNLSIIIGTITFLLVGLVAMAIAKSISAPIDALHKGAEAIGKGNLDFKVATDAKDEIGQLSRAFNDMTENLKAITASRDELNNEITGRKRAEDAEETLKKANEQLKKLDQMKSEFVSIASHELRTPLTSIKNSVDLMLSGKTGELTDGQEKFLSMAKRNINRLSDLINDLLDISRIEAGKMDLTFSEVDIRNPIENVIDTLKTLANDKAISFRIKSSHNLPEIYGDSFRIEQVLTNFVGNAIKFTHEKGSITINARQVNEAPDMPEGANEFVEISVADTGVGISEKHIVHIFEKFYQADSSLDRHQQSDSTGLGLAISKGIVEAHGGRVWCNSKESEGSTFFFTLPVFKKENKHFLHLINEISKARIQNAPLSVVVVTIKDLDNVMNIYGEEGCAKVLKTVRERIIETGMKNTDRVEISYVECEIIVSLPVTARDGALAVTKRMEEQVAGKEIDMDGGAYTPTLITGSATFPEDGTSADELVKVAKKGNG